MTHASFYKSPDLLVLRGRSVDELMLIQRGTKNAAQLEGRASRFWRSWNGGPIRDESDLAIVGDLAGAGLVFEGPPPLPCPQSSVDSLVPRSAGRHVRWYREAPGFCVIFDTGAPNIYPLGEIASLCWEGIVAGQTVGTIRSSLQQAFGEDVGLHALRLFAEFALIEPIPGLIAPGAEPPSLRYQFHIPAIEYWLPHARVPWTCDWELNTICNLRCRHCYLPHHKGHGASREMALDICDQLIDCGAPFVELLGGEVLLRDDLEQIVARLSAADVHVSAVSNGTLMTAERARGLVDAGLKRLMFSFDGMDAATHDACRGSGNFERTIAAVSHARAAGIPCIETIWTIHAQNFKDLPRLPDFLDEIGIGESCIDLFKKTGKLGARSVYTPLSADQVAATRAAIAAWRTSHSHLSISFEPKCTCGRTRLTIGADGSIRTCTFATEAKGNLRERSLAEIWASNLDGYATAGPIGYCKSC